MAPPNANVHASASRSRPLVPSEWASWAVAPDVSERCPPAAAATAAKAAAMEADLPGTTGSPANGEARQADDYWASADPGNPPTSAAWRPLLAWVVPGDAAPPSCWPTAIETSSRANTSMPCQVATCAVAHCKYNKRKKQAN